jgi:hypothetical protein
MTGSEVSPVAIAQMLVSSDTQDKLGRDGVAEVAASLWPVDCQTCGRPLGSLPRPCASMT